MIPAWKWTRWAARPGCIPNATRPKPDATDADRRQLLLKNLKKYPRPWTARFVCSVALALPEGGCQLAHGACEGEIIPEERGTQGFGYDSIFLFQGARQDHGRVRPGGEEPHQPPGQGGYEYHSRDRRTYKIKVGWVERSKTQRITKMLGWKKPTQPTESTPSTGSGSVFREGAQEIIFPSTSYAAHTLQVFIRNVTLKGDLQLYFKRNDKTPSVPALRLSTLGCHSARRAHFVRAGNARNLRLPITPYAAIRAGTQLPLHTPSKKKEGRAVQVNRLPFLCPNNYHVLNFITFFVQE